MLNRARVAGLPLVLTLVLFLASPAAPSAATRKAPAHPPAFPPITLAVDATDAPRQILHSHAEMQPPPGPLTLVFAKWIPGEHAPSGPLTDIAGLHFQADGAPLAWQRDRIDMQAFHLTVPAGARSLAVDFDFLPPKSEDANGTSQLTLVSWNTVILYPRGVPTDALTVVSSLHLPTGWKFGTALPVSRTGDDRVEFAPASLTTLIDSPVLLGAHMKTFALTTAPVHEIDAAADGEAALAAPADFAAQYSSLVAEAQALFGAHHYRDYHFLLTLSDHTAHFGLEHHESSDDRIDEQALLKDGLRRSLAGLLAHEFIHSWNGKYPPPRRPPEPRPSDADAGRSAMGLRGAHPVPELPPAAAERSVDNGLHPRADRQDHRRARSRDRPHLAAARRHGGRFPDHARAAPRLAGLAPERLLLRRVGPHLARGRYPVAGTDRRQGLDGRFLPPFPRRHQRTAGGQALYLRGGGGDPQRPPALRLEGFFNARLTSTAPLAPRGGLEASGWKLTYSDAPNQAIKDREERLKFNDWTYSLGIAVEEDGTIVDTITGSPAAKAGVGPSMKLVAVNGRAFKPEWMEAALRAAQGSQAAIELLVENNEYYKTFKIDYHEGPRYPHLEKQPGQPDLLSQILAPHAPPRIP